MLCFKVDLLTLTQSVIYLYFVSGTVLGRTDMRVKSSSENVHIGDTWNLTCTIQYDTDSAVALVMLKKRIGGIEYEVAINNFLNPPFKESGRYVQQLVMHEEDKEDSFEMSLVMTLQINGKSGISITKFVLLNLYWS